MTPTTDFKLIARLNETVQTLHRQRYPELFKEYSYEPVERFFKKLLKQKAWHALVVTYTNEPIGYALFCERKYADNPFRRGFSVVHLDQLSFIREYQRQGLGTKVMAWIEEFARQHGAQQIELSYWERNVEAQGFYQKLGFSPTHRYMVKPLDSPLL
ncbi:MAG: GNAT family N-acetyltransferase [Spirochaetales bacterium]|nr:GNAT family N-acetyltransferase [Spirochaetales bacterium]